MNKLLLVPFLALLVFLQARAVLADENSNKKDQVEINSIMNGCHEEDLENDEDNDENKTKTIINKKEFKIKGQISSLGTNSFIINGQTIKIDPLITKQVEQKGILAIGLFAKVEGRVINDILYAKEIEIKYTTQEDL